MKRPSTDDEMLAEYEFDYNRAKPNRIVGDSMLILEVKSQTLAEKINRLLSQKFDNNSDKMLQELVENYIRQQNRLAYSGILTWQKDGLEYQKEIRHEWQ